MKWPGRNTRTRAEFQETAAIETAQRLHRDADFVEAERRYRALLRRVPDDPVVRHYLGLLLHQTGRSADGIALIEAVLDASPGYSEAHNNLGNIKMELGHPDRAEACYRRALEAAADNDQALGNLAATLAAQERFPEAAEQYQMLVKRAPSFPGAYHQLGKVLRQMALTKNEFESVAECFRSALRHDSESTKPYEDLSAALNVLERPEEAGAVNREWAVREPDNPIARHLAAASEGRVPARPDDAYLRTTFDEFADTFDEQLQRLEYRAPSILMAALQPHLGPPIAALAVLDAGCGTGLCGPLFRPYARFLDGVDLSPKMMERARLRGYDHLAVGELTAFMCGSPCAFDLVVSADTLIYFGDLGEVIATAAGALRPNGLLAFTVEALNVEGDRVDVAVNGRCRHTRAHIERCLAAAGLTPLSLQTDTLRKETGKPVQGWVVVARLTVAEAASA